MRQSRIATVSLHNVDHALLLKVVSCLLAAVLADPLGAGAAGDGCELQKVLRKENMSFHNSTGGLDRFVLRWNHCCSVKMCAALQLWRLTVQKLWGLIS